MRQYSRQFGRHPGTPVGSISYKDPWGLGSTYKDHLSVA
jgi:hypothetical protein